MYVAYEEQCGNCCEYDFQGDNYKGYCSYYREYYYPGESCSHQSPRRSSSESSGCYITTIVCNILKYSDNCCTLNILRSFRNNVMQKDEKYKSMLFEYDTVGPKIAESLYSDYQKDNDDELALSLYNNYIVPTAGLVVKKDYEQAVLKYQEMTRLLEEHYKIFANDVVPKNYDYTTGGHGYVKKIGTYPNAN